MDNLIDNTSLDKWVQERLSEDGSMEWHPDANVAIGTEIDETGCGSGERNF